MRLGLVALVSYPTPPPPTNLFQLSPCTPHCGQAVGFCTPNSTPALVRKKSWNPDYSPADVITPLDNKLSLYCPSHPWGTNYLPLNITPSESQLPVLALSSSWGFKTTLHLGVFLWNEFDRNQGFLFFRVTFSKEKKKITEI